MAIDARARRKRRIRRLISGTAERPRMTFTRSLKSLYVQAIDDTQGRTLAAASSRGKKNVAAGKALGEQFGKALQEAKITTVVFDRNGYRYHGVVKEFADGVRSAGIAF